MPVQVGGRLPQDLVGVFSLRSDGWPLFLGKAIPPYGTLEHGLWTVLDLPPARFVAEANRLFEKYRVVVPDYYPAKCEVRDAFDVRDRRPELADGLRRIADEFEGRHRPDGKPAFDTFEAFLAELHRRLDRFRIQHIVPWDTFAEAVAFCVLIEADHDVEVGSILHDLIDCNSREGILHAATTAAVILHSIRAGISVEIVPREAEKKTPDLLLDGVTCEVKVVDQSDVAVDVSWETGRSDTGRLSEDLCYDVGTFISRTACKGIAQADLVLADLSRKSMAHVPESYAPKVPDPGGSKPVMEAGLPPPQKHRFVFVARHILDFTSTFVDVDPALWRVVREDRVTNQTTVISLPAKGPITL